MKTVTLAPLTFFLTCHLACTAPSVQSNVSEDWTVFDGLRLHGAGPDSTAKRLLLTQGWSIANGQSGGVGATLQVKDPTGSVVLVWANNQFSEYRLTKQWVGQTARGAGIGTTKAEFANLYPEFTISASHASFSDTLVGVDVLFVNEVVTEIDVTWMGLF